MAQGLPPLHLIRTRGLVQVTHGGMQATNLVPPPPQIYVIGDQYEERGYAQIVSYGVQPPGGGGSAHRIQMPPMSIIGDQTNFEGISIDLQPDGLVRGQVAGDWGGIIRYGMGDQTNVEGSSIEWRGALAAGRQVPPVISSQVIPVEHPHGDYFRSESLSYTFPVHQFSTQQLSPQPIVAVGDQTDTPGQSSLMSGLPLYHFKFGGEQPVIATGDQTSFDGMALLVQAQPTRQVVPVSQQYIQQELTVQAEHINAEGLVTVPLYATGYHHPALPVPVWIMGDQTDVPASVVELFAPMPPTIRPAQIFANAGEQAAFDGLIWNSKVEAAFRLAVPSFTIQVRMGDDFARGLGDSAELIVAHGARHFPTIQQPIRVLGEEPRVDASAVQQHAQPYFRVPLTTQASVRLTIGDQLNVDGSMVQAVRGTPKDYFKNPAIVVSIGDQTATEAAVAKQGAQPRIAKQLATVPVVIGDSFNQDALGGIQVVSPVKHLPPRHVKQVTGDERLYVDGSATWPLLPASQVVTTVRQAWPPGHVVLGDQQSAEPGVVQIKGAIFPQAGSAHAVVPTVRFTVGDQTNVEATETLLGAKPYFHFVPNPVVATTLANQDFVDGSVPKVQPAAPYRQPVPHGAVTATIGDQQAADPSVVQAKFGPSRVQLSKPIFVIVGDQNAFDGTVSLVHVTAYRQPVPRTSVAVDVSVGDQFSQDGMAFDPMLIVPYRQPVPSTVVATHVTLGDQLSVEGSSLVVGAKARRQPVPSTPTYVRVGDENWTLDPRWTPMYVGMGSAVTTSAGLSEIWLPDARSTVFLAQKRPGLPSA
jgi:hypothetical protein